MSISTTPLFQQLNQKWETSLSDASWTFAVLGKVSCQTVLDTFRKLEPKEQDQLLLQLIHEAKSGVELATHVLIKITMPRIIHNAQHSRGLKQLNNNAEALSISISEMYGTIASYNTKRTHSVYANLGLNCLREITKTYPIRPEILTDDISIFENLTNSLTSIDSPESDLQEVLMWALDYNHLSSQEISFLLRATSGTSCERKAHQEEIGCSSDTYRQRQRRITVKLMNSAKQYLDSISQR